MIYVDMDGVVADFDQAVFDIFKQPYSNDVAQTFWNVHVVSEQVFRYMHPIQEGLDMVTALQEIDTVCFLTSTGGGKDHINIAKQKLGWLSDYCIDTPVAFCMSTQGKGEYAKPGAFLIDDRQKVCDEWEEQGGVSLLFTRDQAHKISDAIIRFRKQEPHPFKLQDDDHVNPDLSATKLLKRE